MSNLQLFVLGVGVFGFGYLVGKFKTEALSYHKELTLLRRQKRLMRDYEEFANIRKLWQSEVLNFVSMVRNDIEAWSEENEKTKWRENDKN